MRAKPSHDAGDLRGKLTGLDISARIIFAKAVGVIIGLEEIQVFCVTVRVVYARPSLSGSNCVKGGWGDWKLSKSMRAVIALHWFERDMLSYDGALSGFLLRFDETARMPIDTRTCNHRAQIRAVRPMISPFRGLLIGMRGYIHQPDSPGGHLGQGIGHVATSVF